MTRNFLRIAEGLDTSGLRLALAAQPELWNQFPIRTAPEQSAHRAVDDILLRYSPWTEGQDYLDKVCASVEVVTFPAWHKLPLAAGFVYGMLQRVGGLHLGRVMISRLRPGGSIPPHSDRIAEAEARFPDRIPPSAYYQRYHVVLASAPGTEFFCGDELVWMAPGEAWWFNNQLEHAVFNGSAEDRLHLIMDIRSEHEAPGGPPA